MKSPLNQTPTLLLHSCCTPSSIYCIGDLAERFQITVFYYNPNITPEKEYIRRAREQERLLTSLQVPNPVKFIYGKYEFERFYEISRGLESEPEGGARCCACFRLRLEEAAIVAKKKGFDYFATTLSISPNKNAAKINEIGEEVAKKYEVAYLSSDFSKKSLYNQAKAIISEMELYHQEYCGCSYSRN